MGRACAMEACAWVCCALSACAATNAESGTSVSGKVVQAQQDAVERLNRALAAQERRADELEARVALLESEARSARAIHNGKMAETVVIGGHRGESRDSEMSFSDESPAELNDEPPLKLRLRGTPRPHVAAPPAEPLPLVTEKLPVVPLPAASNSQVVPAKLATSSASSFKVRYAGALGLLRQRAYQAAKEALLSLLRDFPGHAYEDRMTYWVGESAYAQRFYGEAVQYFQHVVEAFPKSDKLPDALLKAGLCHRHLGATSFADRYMARVRRDFPNSDAARLASAEGL